MEYTTITARLPTPLKEWFEQKAKRENRTISSQIVQIIQELYEKEGGENER